MIDRHLTIARLRSGMPGWKWKGVRNGMGWTYEGVRGDRKVQVQSYAVMAGDDDYASQWVVTENGVRTDYASWYMREEQ